MEQFSRPSGSVEASTSYEALHFGCKENHKFLEIQNYLLKLSEDEQNGPLPEIILRVGEEEMAIHATVLAALSSSWRQYLHKNNQDTQIIHSIALDLPAGLEFLPMLKSLLYCGKAVLPSVSVDHLVSIVRALNLDYTEFILSDSSSEEQILIWEGHHDQLVKGLQQMCSNQLCTDLSIFVNGHLIKVHRLVLSAYSSVLRSVFQENSQRRLIHLPGISVKSGQCLVAFMYYNKASIDKTLIQEFHKLCTALEVVSLTRLTKGMCGQTSELQVEESEKQVNLLAKIKPEVGGILNRLQHLYNLVGKTDLTFLVEKKRIMSHKALLSAASPLVNDMLVEELSDGHSVILVLDANYISIRGLLSLIYNGSCTIAETSKKTICSYLDENIFSFQCDIVESQSPEKKTVPAEPRRVISFMRSGKMHKNSTKKSTSEENFDISQTLFKPIGNNVTMKSSPERDSVAESGSEGNVGPGDITKKCVNDLTASLCDGQVKEGEEEFIKPSKRRRKSKVFSCEEWVTDKASLRAMKAATRTKAEDTVDDKTFLEKDGVFKVPLRTRSGDFIRGRRGFKRSAVSSSPFSQLHKKKRNEDIEMCQICGEYLSIKNMWTHMKTHKAKHKCDYCKKTFLVKSLLNEHLELDHAHEESEDTDVPDNEVQVCVAQGMHQCVVCCALFSTRHQLRVHKRMRHRQGGLYRCNDCDAIFPHLNGLRRHKKNEHPSPFEEVFERIEHPSPHEKEFNKSEHTSPFEKVFTCFGCDKQFKKLVSMRSHERRCHQKHHNNAAEMNDLNSSVTRTAQWSCNHCTYRCSDYGELTQHVNQVHIVDINNSKQKSQGSVREEQMVSSISEPNAETEDVDFIEFPIGNSNNTFSCPECGKNFSNIECFSAHAEKEGHGGLVGSCWICGICKNAFFEESQLNEHLASHNPLPEYLPVSDAQKQESSVYDPSNLSSRFERENHSPDSRNSTKLNENIMNKSTQSKNSSLYKVEADSSVLDESSVLDVSAERSDSWSDIEMNVVTSSVSNEKIA